MRRGLSVLAAMCVITSMCMLAAPGAGRLGKSSSMKPGAAAAKPEPMRRAVSITLGEPRKDAMLRSRRLETFVSTDYLPYFDTRPLKEVLAEAEGASLAHTPLLEEMLIQHSTEQIFAVPEGQRAASTEDG